MSRPEPNHPQRASDRWDIPAGTSGTDALSIEVQFFSGQYFWYTEFFGLAQLRARQRARCCAYLPKPSAN